jgi:hypothetical protein
MTVWQKKRITVPRADGSWVRTQAKVLGKLAVHQSLNDFGKFAGWSTITHVPTGYAVTDGLTKPTALELAEELQRLDWNFERPEDLSAETLTQGRELIAKYRGRKLLARASA